MPNAITRSRSLSQLYVFYERLKDDGYMDLYGYVNSSLDTQGAELNNVVSTTSTLRTMAQREAIKEQNLINKIFNTSITVDLTNSASIKSFIDALNAFLGLKEVYERNIHLIKNSEGSKSVISFFPTYFIQAWNKKWPDMWAAIESKIDTASPKQVILSLVEEVIDDNMPEIVEEGIELMFTAKPELNSMDNNMADAYLSLISAIGKVQNQGSLANQIYHIYKLDEFSKQFTELLKNKNKRFLKQEIEKLGNIQGNEHELEKIAKKTQAPRGGLTLEAIENTVLSIIANELSSISGVKVEATRTGELGIKADNILTYGIDSEIIDETLQANEKVSRERNIKMFDKLGEKLKNIRDGYIVYSSAKNYTYNKGFKERGGFSGENISLETYNSIMSNVHNNISTFTGTILQLTKGAIGERRGLRPLLEDAIAHDVTYLLFDDFKTIGNEVGAGDTQAIHIMDLNGILIPLSFLLTIYANALETYAYQPRDIVKVNIKTTSIEFPDRKSQYLWELRNGRSAWDYQREVALNETMIALHFLREFKDIVASYL